MRWGHAERDKTNRQKDKPTGKQKRRLGKHTRSQSLLKQEQVCQVQSTGLEGEYTFWCEEENHLPATQGLIWTVELKGMMVQEADNNAQVR